VGVAKRLGYRHSNPDRLIDRQLPLAVEARPKRLALDERHDIVEVTAGFARIEQRDEIRMLEVCRDLDLGEEALGAEYLTYFRLEDFQRDEPIMANVACAEYRGHPSRADLALNEVTASQSLMKRSRGFHGNATRASEAMVDPWESV
jgi:hypothetical protein